MLFPETQPKPIVIVEGHNEDGQVTWLLEYYLKIYRGEEETNQLFFGIEIVRTHPNGEFDSREESGAVTSVQADAMEMIEIFSKGTVRPQTLVDHVDEYFSTKVLDGSGHAHPIEMYSHHESA